MSQEKAATALSPASYLWAVPEGRFSPEHTLLAAIIAQAVEERREPMPPECVGRIQVRNWQRQRTLLERFFREPNGMFEWACGHLNLDADAIRDMLSREADQIAA